MTQPGRPWCQCWSLQQTCNLATTIDSFAWSITGAVGASLGGLLASKLGKPTCFLIVSRGSGGGASESPLGGRHCLVLYLMGSTTSAVMQ
jgi:hypothetical protein